MTVRDDIVCHLPVPRNRRFAGREADLAWIAETLETGRPAALLHAGGGVGKSQIAAEFAHSHLNDYKVVWWMTADTPTAADSGYRALAEALQLPGSHSRDAAATRAAVVAWMARETGWLVVLDNAGSPDALPPWLPEAPKGHLLITAHSPDWPIYAAARDIGPWLPVIALEFVVKYGGDPDRAAAGKLVKNLGCLPLACDIAAAYIAETGCGLTGFAERLNDQPVALMEWLPDEPIYRQNLPKSVALAIALAGQDAPLASAILFVLAWLAPDNIPRGLLPDIDEVDAAVAALVRVALVGRTDGGLGLHLVVQQIVRGIDPRPMDSAAAAILALNRALSGDPQHAPHLWPRYGALLSHGEALFAVLPDPPPEPRAASRICVRFGQFLRHVRGDDRAARPWYEKALALAEAGGAPEHPDVAVALANLGGLLRAIGDLPAAKSLLQRALAIGETALGPQHPRVAQYLAGLGEAHRLLGELDEARHCHERSLTVTGQVYGPDHLLMAAGLNNLALVLQAQGEQAAALAHFERALQICLDHPARGPDHPETAARLIFLAWCLFEQGDAAAAEPHLRRALAIRENQLDPAHPDLAATRQSLAMVQSALARQRRLT